MNTQVRSHILPLSPGNSAEPARIPPTGRLTVTMPVAWDSLPTQNIRARNGRGRSPDAHQDQCAWVLSALWVRAVCLVGERKHGELRRADRCPTHPASPPVSGFLLGTCAPTGESAHEKLLSPWTRRLPQVSTKWAWLMASPASGICMSINSATSRRGLGVITASPRPDAQVFPDCR